MQSEPTTDPKTIHQVISVSFHTVFCSDYYYYIKATHVLPMFYLRSLDGGQHRLRYPLASTRAARHQTHVCEGCLAVVVRHVEERARPHRPERHVLESLQVGLGRVVGRYKQNRKRRERGGKGGNEGGTRAGRGAG